jgi:hypothetical protein
MIDACGKKLLAVDRGRRALFAVLFYDRYSQRFLGQMIPARDRAIFF